MFDTMVHGQYGDHVPDVALQNERHVIKGDLELEFGVQAQKIGITAWGASGVGKTPTRFGSGHTWA